MPEYHIIITGNPVGGFEYHGPFPGAEEALTWADANCQGEEWWATRLSSPDAD